jgi:hypothetical protein
MRGRIGSWYGARVSVLRIVCKGWAVVTFLEKSQHFNKGDTVAISTYGIRVPVVRAEKSPVGNRV